MLLLVCIPLLSSCFELREELYLHKEGWGNYKLLADFSKDREMLEALFTKTDTSKHNPFGEVGESFEELATVWGLGADKLNQINGISKAKKIVDKKRFIIGIQFEFQDISALNLALTLKDGGEFNPNFELPFNYHKGKLMKNNVFIFQKLLKYLDTSNETDERFNNEKKAIFAQISCKTIINTSGKIKKCSNYQYEQGRNEREVVANFYLRDIWNGAVDISTLIKFK